MSHGSLKAPLAEDLLSHRNGSIARQKRREFGIESCAMKRALVLAVGILLVAIVRGQDAPAAEIYQNGALNFAFRIPAGYKVVERDKTNDEKTKTLLYLEDSSGGGIVLSAVDAGTPKEMADAEPQDFLPGLRQNMAKKADPVGVPRLELERVGGQWFGRADFRAKKTDQLLTLLITVAQNKVLQILVASKDRDGLERAMNVVRRHLRFGAGAATELKRPWEEKEEKKEVRLDPGMSQGTLIKQVRPHYPVEARRQKLEGTVKLDVLIGTDGLLQRISVSQGPPLLAEAAIPAVKQWEYQPYKVDGRVVEVETTITVNFHLGADW